MSQEKPDPLPEPLPSSAPAPPRFPAWLDWVVLAAILALSFALRWPFREVSLIRDEGEYAYAGQQILKGAVPYADVYNQKTPFVFYLMALIQKTAGNDDASLRIATALYGLFVTFLLYGLARMLFGRGPALVAALAFSIMTFDQCGVQHSASTEFFLLLWMVLALLFWYRGWQGGRPWLLLLAGAAAGLGYQTKQSGLLLLIFFALELAAGAMRSRSPLALARRLPAYALVLAGFAVILGLTLTYFAWKGALGDYLACTWTRNWQYVGRRHRGWSDLLALIRVVLADISDKGDLGFWIWGSAGLIGLALRAAPLAGRAHPNCPEGMCGRDLWLLLAVCAGFGLLGGAPYAHYWEPLILPLSLGNAVSAGWLWRQARRPALGLPLRLALAALVLGPWIQPAAAYARYLRMSDREMAWLRERFLPVGARQAARYLAEHTSPDDCILIAGSEPEIYYYAGRKACTRLIFTYPLTGRYTYAAQLRQEFVADLVEHRPRYVVLVTDRASWTEEPDQMPLLLRPVMDVLEREYQAELTLGPGPRAPPSIVVYLRKGA